MAYDKGSGGGGKMMNNGVGVCSYKKNPMGPAREVAPKCGPGMNADQTKANNLLQKAQKQKDSLRGKSGMQTMRMLQDAQSGLTLPSNFVDEKQSLKKIIEDWVEMSVNAMGNVRENYFLTFHAKFDRFDPTVFAVDSPKVTYKLPPFMSNSMVFWVSPKRGLKELLWMVAPCKKGQRLKVEFNQSGVAYLQAKGAMPS